MSDKPDPILQQKEQQQLKKQLLWRLGIAGTLIAGVLGAISWLDREEKNLPPEVQIPQIAPAASSVSVITTPTSAPIETTPEVASTPAATEVPTPVPTVTAAPRSQPAPNQSQVEPISNIPKRITETSLTKSPKVAAPTELPAEPKLKLNTTESGLTAVPRAPFPAASNTQLGYSVQAGVFLHSNNAEKLLAQIQAAGIPAYLETRVQIGPFKTKAEAEAAVKKLRKLGIEPIVKTQ
jgi:DedD protein